MVVVHGEPLSALPPADGARAALGLEELVILAGLQAVRGRDPGFVTGLAPRPLLAGDAYPAPRPGEELDVSVALAPSAYLHPLSSHLITSFPTSQVLSQKKRLER